MIFRTILDSRTEEEKCCHNKRIPIYCHGRCTPESSVGKLEDKNIIDVCNRLMDLIMECTDISKGTF